MTVRLTSTASATWFLSGQVEEGTATRDVPIDASPFQVGRKCGVPLRIPSPTVSNIHAEFVQQEGRLILRDLGSTNGTYVNGVRILVDTQVDEGDLIQFSNIVFRLIRQAVGGGVDTLQGDSCDRAMALIQFDRLMNRRAIIPFYQPIVRAGDYAVVAYEVLGRSPLFGLKTPDLMFQAAAQLNLEGELSRLCRHVGVEQCQQYGTTRHLFLNTHPIELQKLDALTDSLRELRQQHPDLCMTLEIHEAAVTDAGVMRQLHAALKAMRVDVAYDDFGSGQARLIELIEVPPDVLKFDIGLTRNLPCASSKRRRMLQSLVQMVREVGIQALAEGMETEAEAKACVDLGFDLHQGFYYGQPVSARHRPKRN